MKTWTKAELVELGIEATAYGKNYNAKEANANKHSNNGAGGSLNVDPAIPEVPVIPEVPGTPEDELS